MAEVGTVSIYIDDDYVLESAYGTGTIALDPPLRVAAGDHLLVNARTGLPIAQYDKDGRLVAYLRDVYTAE
jgi:hypothetical protein